MKASRKDFWFKRRELWLPRWPTIVGFFILALGLIGGFAFSVHPYLAVSEKRASADAIVVEGWVADYSLPFVVDEFRSGSYGIVGVTGIPIEKGAILVGFKNSGVATGKSLVGLGLDESEVMVSSAAETFRHRTYHSAKAMRDALNTSGRTVSSINLITQSVHARRSRMVFEKVFGDDVEVGIVALPNESYDNDRWWGSSQGIKIVGMELIALTHEWLFDSGRDENE